MSQALAESSRMSNGADDPSIRNSLTPAAGNPAPGPAEASLLPRFVALLTPFFAVAAGAFASWISKYTGIIVDQAQITVLMSLAATAALAASWKWMQGWQQHERLVAAGQDVPRRVRTKAPAGARNG